MSNHNLKPGDLAILISAKCEHNIGKVVTIIEDLGLVDRLEWDGVPYVCQDPIHVLIIECENDLQTHAIAQICGAKPTLRRGPVPIWRLMPLRGDFTPERQKSQEVPA